MAVAICMQSSFCREAIVYTPVPVYKSFRMAPCWMVIGYK